MKATRRDFLAWCGGVSAALAAGGVRAAEAEDRALKAAIDSAARSAADRARDKYRHPYETLRFFGIRPDMAVVELWPFGGWYTAILAPYLEARGRLIEAINDPEGASQEFLNFNAQLQKMLASDPRRFGKVETVFLSPTKPMAPEGSLDMVLTFRNIHNWAWAGIAEGVFAQSFKVLKPGGILGVTEHRSNDPDSPPKRGNAYIGVNYAIKLIEAQGFKLAGQSEINANPKDTKDYPRGVYSLPPILREGEVNRAKYEAIGESDRFTLKFVKPA
jgi:predicted methyltransferase